MQVILTTNVEFKSPHPDLGIALTPIANAVWINTSDGVVVVDTLLRPALASIMREKILEAGGPIKYIIYTHGHVDHVGGAPVFAEDQPEIIGHRYLPDRLEKYRILAPHRSRVGSIQFNLPFRPDIKPTFVEPSKTYDETYAFTLGDKTFELYHARAETDDATWIFIPEIRTAIMGDLVLGTFPNIGNPFKPTRFALTWARALEQVLAKKPEILITNGRTAVYEGQDAAAILEANIEAIYWIHDQVVEWINQDIPVDEMIHLIEIPEHIKNNPYLNFAYSRPEFAIYNIYRWYHGYFDHNPAHLLPRPDKEVNTEIFELIGDPQSILDRAGVLFEQGQAQLAIQVLDVLLKKDSQHAEGRKLHLRLLKKLAEDDFCLMSRNTWIYYMERDEELIEAQD